jgi:iron complex transport system ATP-binding protein
MRLQLNNLSVDLGGKHILDALSLTLEGPGLIGLVGPNGAGKTTFLRAIASLLPFRGSILWDGCPIASLAPRQRARLISYLAQGATAHWPLEVARLVTLGRLPHLEPFRLPGKIDEEAVEHAMQLADVGAFRDRNVLTLSGGERARVFLARALAVEAPLLLVDEPVASLDPYHQLGIMEVLKAYSGAGRTVIAVLHDLSLASRFCDRLLLLDKGRLHAEGTPDQVLTEKNLREIYRVKALAGGEGAGRYIIPVSQSNG